MTKRSGFAGFVLVAIMALASACTTAEPIVGPDGTRNILIKGDTIEDCYQKARETCGGNYKIINSNSDSDNFGTVFDVLVKCDGARE